MNFFHYRDTEKDYLKKQDMKLGAAIEEIDLIRRPVAPDLFTALIAGIASQYIAAKAAETVWMWMEVRFGKITPETIAAATAGEIRQCGMSMRKAAYIRGISDEVAGGKLDPAGLYSLSDDEVIARLAALKGVGIRTAEMMRLCGRQTLDRAQFERYRKRYSPYGSVASLYLWERWNCPRLTEAIAGVNIPPCHKKRKIPRSFLTK